MTQQFINFIKPATTDKLELSLPFPPSVNHYWRHVKLGKRHATLISKEGRQYQNTILGVVLQLRPRIMFIERVGIRVMLEMPDRRRRDIDNYLKSLLDALTQAGVWLDDSQIDRLEISRGGVMPPGRAIVEIYRL